MVQPKRRIYPSINQFRDFVVKEFNKRKRGPSAVPTPAISPFARMTSAVEDGEEKYRWFSLGLHGITDSELEGNIFNMTYGMQDIVGFGYDTPGFTTNIQAPVAGLQQGFNVTIYEGDRVRRRPIQARQSPQTNEQVSAEGTHPIPGITSVDVKYKGINDVINVDVSWKCYDVAQLNFLRNHFLLAGNYVVLEYGHIISNRVNTEPIKPFDFGSTTALAELTSYEVGGRQTITDGDDKKKVRGLIRDNNGNYDMIIGKVIDSSISLLADNTYDCKTTIVSVGESIYGVTHHSLITDLGNELTEDEKNEYIATISEFFEEGGQLDAMVGLWSQRQLEETGFTDVAGQPFIVNAGTLRGRTTFSPGTEHLKEGARIAEADQVIFVSWNFFTHEIITQMFSMIREQKVNSEIELFNSIGQPIFNPELGIDQVAGESLIGNNPNLLSADHEVLVLNKRLVKKQIDEGEIDIFTNAKFFDDGIVKDEHTGYLSRGVYLNVDAIKESFKSQRTFYDGMAQLLRKMNDTTSNYWKLDIGFDEETRKVYIFDRGTITDSVENVPVPYLFNRGVSPNQSIIGPTGELTELTFNASYTDEVKTSIMISAATKGRSSFAGVTTAADHTVAVGPDRHGQILNTSHLTNILQNSVNSEIERNRQARLAVLGKSSATERANAIQIRHQAQGDLAKEREKRRKEQQEEIEETFEKFKPVLQAYIAVPSDMKMKITRDGLHNANTVNNYLSPLATEISADLTIMGISGIAFWDCFQIDKIPKVYTEHGLFLVNGISHSIGRNGWFTTLTGLYYFMWRDENQGAVVQDSHDVHSLEEQGPTTVTRREQSRKWQEENNISKKKKKEERLKQHKQTFSEFSARGEF